MKLEIGRCLLADRLLDLRLSHHKLASMLQYRTERVQDYMENKRVMPLKVAVSIADTLGCDVKELYEWVQPLPNKERNT